MCCGDPLRRLVSKCFCIGAKDQFATEFKGKNYGVGCPGGVEIVAHALREVVSHPPAPGLALLKIDFKNAFNLVDRSNFMEAACLRFPFLEPWITWSYSRSSYLFYDHSNVISSECGVQQGDPLGSAAPLLPR